MKNQGNGILYEMFGELLSLYIPRRFFCVYKGILFYHSSFAKFI